MATTRLMTTVLPYSVSSADPFHVSLFISFRLDGGGTLSDYAAMTNWVKTLKGATITLHSAEAGATPIACTPLFGKASETAWQTAFPADTRVGDYPEPKPSSATWNSFDANRIPEHALDVHYASALSSPIDRPRVVGNPFAGGLLTAFKQENTAHVVIAALEQYDDERTDRLDKLKSDRARAVQKTIAPDRPRPDVPHGPAIAGAAAEDRPWRSPIEILLDPENADCDGSITAFLDLLLNEPGAAAGNPLLGMLIDLHRAQHYYFRKQEQVPPQPRPDTAVALARLEPAEPDFHERIAAACNVPALARALGIVVDLKVDDLATLKKATRIWCDVDVHVDGVEKYVSPETFCVVNGDRFLAKAKDETRWNFGRLRLGDPDQYRVMDLDPDAGALALEQLCRSAVRAFATELNGDSGSFAPAGLRSTGFALAELDRSGRLQEQISHSENLTPVVEVSGTAQTREQFNFEALLRGLRVEVWDDATNHWHSLHERLVTASFTDSPILNAVDDPGLLQNPPLSQVPGDATNQYYVHEVLAGWDGWSLSAPRPGKQVIHNADASHGEPGRERLTDTPEATTSPGLWVRSVVKPKTLPALRYGRKYSFRIAGVDLAGNSVPMGDAAAIAVEQSLIDATATHLDTLRAKARDREQAGVLASLRGSLNPAEPNGHGTRGAIERATAAVVEHASSLRRYPHFDGVDLERLAALSADADDAKTVTVPRLFLRWDPIPAPTLVPREAYTTGESVQHMVIRTGLSSGPGLCQRHIVPPKGSEMEAEQDGRFDEWMRTGQTARAYATALKERGNLYHTHIQDLHDPNKTIAQPGIKLLSMPNATDKVDLEDIQDPEKQPGAGQYIVHDVDNLVIPYLPDPMADGVTLVFYDAGADHRMTNPRVLQAVTIKYAGTWPELHPLRLVLHTSDRLDASLDEDNNVLRVGLPPGEQVAVRYATTLDAGHLAKMGLWQFHPVTDPNVPVAERRLLEQAAQDGWMWWLTPDEDLRLVHATARPAIAPRISRLIAEPRKPFIATASLDGVIDVHGPSTEKVELRATWTDPVDDPAKPEPTERTAAEVVVDHRIDATERFSLFTAEDQADTVGTRKVDVPIRPAIHTLPDTKARTVTYRLHGSSRYREFFLPDELPGTDDPGSEGNEVEVNIPSSAHPAPPVVHDVIPMFLWEQTTEPEHPFAVRRVRRSGVRIWLDRPWYSSGDGEMLAVITTGDPGLVAKTPEHVSLWARDPIVASPAIAKSYEVPVLSAWQQRAVQLQLVPESLPGRPERHAVVQPPATGKNQDEMINAYAYRPEFHKGRGMWFVDVVLESQGAAWPFLRLAVARYQPNSIPGMEFSEIVATNFVQIPPERIGTLSRPDIGTARVTVTGASAVTNAPGVTVLANPGDLLPKTHQVFATLQTRNMVSGSDIDWNSGSPVPCTLAGVEGFTATWTAELDLVPPEQLATPPVANDQRVLVEEYELLSADPRPGESGVTETRRLVYADHFYV